MRPAFVFTVAAQARRTLTGRMISLVALGKILTVTVHVEAVCSRKIHRHLLEYMIYWPCRTVSCLLQKRLEKMVLLITNIK